MVFFSHKVSEHNGSLFPGGMAQRNTKCIWNIERKEKNNFINISFFQEKLNRTGMMFLSFKEHIQERT